MLGGSGCDIFRVLAEQKEASDMILAIRTPSNEETDVARTPPYQFAP
jgi:hypothetical protein